MTTRELAELAMSRLGKIEKDLDRLNEKKAPLDWVCQKLNIPIERAREEIERKLE